MKKAYLGIGTNIGDRLGNLQTAVDSVSLLPCTYVKSVSRVYETAPVGYDDQDDFLNIVVEVMTDLTSQGLLGACLGIEAGMGRIRTLKNGPRVIDLDLLLYENEVFDSLMLTLPHPRMFEREFVIRPLLDIEFDSPFLNRDVLSKSLTGEGIRLFDGTVTL